jgi:site-specific recombinase XerD
MSQFIDALRNKIRVKQYSYKTELAYLDWSERFIRFHKLRHPKEMGKAEIEAFLTHLANSGISASTQNQALAAILFMYREMLGTTFSDIRAVRAKTSTHVPTVLSTEEMKQVLGRLHGVYHIIGLLLYGSGMRLMECLRLRVKDIDFELHTITLRETPESVEAKIPVPNPTVVPSSSPVSVRRARTGLAPPCRRLKSCCSCRCGERAITALAAARMGCTDDLKPGSAVMEVCP